MMEKFTEHKGYSRCFREKKLTLGLFFPLESYQGSIPRMDINEQMELAKKAEEQNFAALYVRDVPLYDPGFGDVGQIYDPWVFLGFLAAHTQTIALGAASIVVTSRHPLHVAKAAASADRLSEQRFIMGVATGDRQIEFTAFVVDWEMRSSYFQEAIHVIKKAWKEAFPHIHTFRVNLSNADVLPKPLLGDIPVLVTGHSSQTIQWIAEHADGWMYYPRNLDYQIQLINEWRAATPIFKPFTQSLYIDLAENKAEPPKPIHLGFRAGHKFLTEFLLSLQYAGVNHVILNLKYGKRQVHDVIQELGEEVVPQFPALQLEHSVV